MLMLLIPSIEQRPDSVLLHLWAYLSSPIGRGRIYVYALGTGNMGSEM